MRQNEPSLFRLRDLAYAATSRSGWGAIFMLALGGVALHQASHLRIGTAAAMGPGYFPMMLGILSLGFAALIAVDAWRNAETRVDLGPLRPVILLMASILAFALLLNVAGGVIATAVMLVIGALAEGRRKPLELFLLVLVCVVAVWLGLVVGLNMQIKMLPPGLM